MIMISGVLFFITGLVGWLAGGVLVVYCYGKWQSKHHPPPSQPDPLYEEIVTFTVKGEMELQLRKHHPPPSQPDPLYEEIVTSTVKGEVELQLRDNVAYACTN